MQWIGAFAVAVPLVSLLVVLWPSLNDPWLHSYAYSDGYFILALAVWLVLHEVRRAALGPPRASWLGMAALGFSAVAALLAQFSDVQIGEQLAVPLLLLTALWAAAGWRIGRRFAWPIGYLIFGISIWDSFNETLRSLTTAVAGRLTALVGIPSFIGANEIHIPAGTFAVEGGCSGLHYMIAALALAVFYGSMYYRRWRSRFALLGLAMVVALIANWLRVLVIVLDGQLTNMQGFLITVDHYYFGWALFLVVFAPVFLVARQIERPSDLPGEEGENGRGMAGSPPTVRNSAVTALSFLLLAGAAGLAFTTGRASVARSGGAILLPKALAGWARAGEWTGPDRPRYVGASRQAAAFYRKGRRRLGVFVARYDGQRQGAELVFFANSPMGSGADAGKQEAAVKVATTAGGSFPAAELLVSHSDGGRRLVWYTYNVAGRYTANAVIAKLYQALGLLQHRSEASVLVLSARCDPDCTAARAALSSFRRDAGRIVFESVAPGGASRKPSAAK